MVIYFSLFLLLSSAAANVIQLDQGNIDNILKTNELVFVNFYADWCHFSQMLTPIFNDLGEKVSNDIKEKGKIAIARVDCEKEASLAQSYKVNKYPTLKLIRDGQMTKREYRGQRSTEAFLTYLKEQLHDPVVYHSAGDHVSYEDGKHVVIGTYDNKESNAFKNFKKIANNLRDQCQFHAFIGKHENPDSVEYKEVGAKKEPRHYAGNLDDKEALSKWVGEECVPLVREITFANAEELTEEGLPFLLLFVDPNDKDTIARFRRAVENHLMQEKHNVNFLWGDGFKFSHPLQHLGKSTNDLPILAIDSFRHMYLFPHNIKDGTLEKDNLLKNFVADLHSGKLHREFHYGPDATQAPPAVQPDPETPNTNTPPEKVSGGDTAPDHVPRDGSGEQQKARKGPTTPPESVFKKLQPSRNRYTLLKDEL